MKFNEILDQTPIPSDPRNVLVIYGGRKDTLNRIKYRTTFREVASTSLLIALKSCPLGFEPPFDSRCQ